jgi:hypothetical protein
MMSKAKIKLNPECKRCFLNQATQICSSNFSQTQDDTTVFKFFKLLIVSKSLLNCSRRSKVYRLRLDLPYRLRKGMSFSVLLKKDYFGGGLKFDLTLAQSKTFGRLFRPAFFGIQQGDRVIHRYVKEVYELLRFTDGKIGLFFHQKHPEICHLRLVEVFSSRVHELKCPGELLEDDSLPKLRLDNCEVFNLDSIGQLEKILRHHILKLKITVNCVQYFEREEIALIKKSDNELQANTSVQSMKLHCNELNFDEVKEFANVILKLCPKLKSFYLRAYQFESFPEFFTKEFIARQALSQRQKIMELKQMLATSWIKPDVNLELVISGSANDDDFENPFAEYWYDVDEGEFVGWEADRGYDFHTIDDNPFQEDLFGYNDCSTYLTFEDGECKLDLEITASIYGIKLDM